MLVSEAHLVVNARVAIDPEALAATVRRVVFEESKRAGATATIVNLQSFRPGRPVPTHRLPT